LKNNERDLVRKSEFFRAEMSTFKAKNTVLHDQKADKAKVHQISSTFSCQLLNTQAGDQVRFDLC
jgi:phosphotransferase system HPr-like phosphotransfer protein